MKNSTLTRFAGCLALSAVVGATLTQMTACKKKPPPPPPVRRAAPPPPPPPEPVDLTRIMDSLDGIDARVQFPQEQAPTDESLAENVLLFTSALVSKDAEALRPMMSSAGRDVLSQVEQIWWGTDIDAVRVVMLTAGGGGQPRGGAESPGLGVTAQDVTDLVDRAFERADLNAQLRQMLRPGFELGSPRIADQINAGGIGDIIAQVETRLADTPSMSTDEIIDGRDITALGISDEEFRTQSIALNQALLDEFRDLEESLSGGDAADNIEASDSSATLVTALHDPDGAYVLMWDVQRFDDGWFFTPQAATAELRPSVRDWDNGGLNDYRVELVAAPIIPDIPDDDDDSPNPNSDDAGGGSTSHGG